jgi:peptidoglycan hydrolase-like protein with peptidoglycan-binding domain
MAEDGMEDRTEASAEASAGDSAAATIVARGLTGPAVKDVQERLCGLGYDLGDEATRSSFGPLTAQAVAAFRSAAGLAFGDGVDRDTWTALVDATFTLGDRLLYLRMPHFHGRDVRTLQTALAALGFSCTADGIFGGHTERAVREFQRNAGLGSDGIVGDSTFSAIERLRHAWEGKDQLATGTRPLGFARAAEVLESTPIHIRGIDCAARGVAERIANLALATTPGSLVVSAPPTEQLSDGPLLVFDLLSASANGEGDEPGAAGRDAVLQVVYDSDATINARMAIAIGLAAGTHPRITVLLACAAAEGESLSPREEQHAAIALLDALCLAFS